MSRRGCIPGSEDDEAEDEEAIGSLLSPSARPTRRDMLLILFS